MRPPATRAVESTRLGCLDLDRLFGDATCCKLPVDADQISRPVNLGALGRLQ